MARDKMALKWEMAAGKCDKTKTKKDKKELQRIRREQERQSGINLLTNFLQSERGAAGRTLLEACGESIHIASEMMDGGDYYLFTSQGLMNRDEIVSVEDVVDFIFSAIDNCAISVEKPSDIAYYLEGELNKIADKINQEHITETKKED